MIKMNANLLGLMLVLGGGAHAQVDPNTYQQTCELPSFEWADFGTRVSGRMYTRRAAFHDGSLYAAGYLKSTGAPNKDGFQELEDDFCITGPFNEMDPTGGLFSKVVCSDLVSYTTEYGSFAQYEVGVVKIDTTTGEPEDILVYYGEGQDETSGLAVKALDNGVDNLMAISGHFVGSLTADHSDGTQSTIYNSNADGGSDYVLHPNAVKNGFDDGFVISADAETGDTNWMIAYPLSSKDAQTVGVDIDGEGNIYGAGYSCNKVGLEETVICNGFVAKFAAANGEILWETQYEDLGAAMWVAYDEGDDSLYVTGTTSYIGEATDTESDTKEHKNCDYDICAVTMRLSAMDGTTEWVRTTEGSPRWNFFDQTGDIQLSNELDGPYVYIALDDVGEEGLSTLDNGTPYAACRDENGVLTPEYEISAVRLVTEADCPAGSVFVPRSDEANAFPASDAFTDTNCGAGHEGVDACIIKYHKYTGLPIWGSDVHPVAGLVPSVDGQSVMAAGFYWNKGDVGSSNFDNVELPNYNGIEGAYNAKLNAETGKGEFVQHSGGIGKTRVYDIVGDTTGDLYMVGYTQSAVINWGGSLQTKIIEEGIDQNDDVGTAFQMGKVSSTTNEYQFFAVKLGASTTEPLSCVETCDYTDSMVANRIVQDGHCLIDNVCYQEGEVAELFGRSCLLCNPSKSQTEWSLGAEVGVDVCFIDSVCYDRGDAYSYRQNRANTFVSVCQVCEPSSDDDWWSVAPGYALVYNTTTEVLFEPPNDCSNPTDSPTIAPTLSPVLPTNPSKDVTIQDIPAPPKDDSIENIVEEIEDIVKDNVDSSSDAAESRFLWRSITGILTGCIAVVWLI